jgi:hypothetical protein
MQVQQPERPDGPQGAPGRAAPAGGMPPPRSRARAAWKVLGGLFAAFLLVTGVIQVVVRLAHEEFTIVEEFPAGEVARLDVDSDTGRVTIRGSDANRDTVRVTARVSHGLRRTGHSQRLQDDRLVLDSTCPIFFSDFCEVRYTVEVPTDMDVVVRSSTGRIVVEGVNGDVDLSTDAGSIEVADVDGDLLRMDSDSGSVDATAVGSSDVVATTDAGRVYTGFVDAPRAVRADSDAGRVEVVLPEGDEAYDVEADSAAGSVDVEVNQDSRSSRSVTATSEAGSVTVRYGVG